MPAVRRVFGSDHVTGMTLVCADCLAIEVDELVCNWSFPAPGIKAVDDVGTTAAGDDANGTGASRGTMLYPVVGVES